MIDIHAHILPNIDDGTKSLEESIEILKEAEKNGVTDIIITPHYIPNSTYVSENKEKIKIFKELEKELKQQDIKVQIYLGNEAYFEPKLLELIKKDKVLSLNNSRYILFELPLEQEVHGLKEFIYELKKNNYIPILAHPERYRVFKKNPSLIIELVEMGLLLQGNTESFFGSYGKDAQRLAKLFLKHHLYHFLSSDIHHAGVLTYEKAKTLKKYMSEEEWNQLYINNAKCILNNITFERKDIIPIKKTIFGNWK